MSSSSVRQGLQSCVMESQVLRLKLAPPPPPVVSLSEEKSMRNDETHKTKKKDGDVGGWSFLHECLNKTEDSQPQNVYVHPTLKHSSSMLSNESLEMCTESLGCETGTIKNNIASGDMDEIGLLSLETSTTRRQSEEEGCRRSVWKRIRSRSRSFPPPLTSMREMGGVGVIRPHREEGRLILKLEAPPSAHPYFEAERSNGRLRLRLFHSTHHETSDNEEGEEEEADNDDEEELEGNNEIVEDEMGKRKLARPRRCKESGNRNKGLPNWKPFCVATT